MTRNLPLLRHGRDLAAYLLFALSSTISYSQLCAPNCQDVNLAIVTKDSTEFHAKLFWDDFITNFDCAGTVTYLLSRGGSPVGSGSSDDVGNEEYLELSNVCDFLKDGLRINVSNSLGSCWSTLTFKEGGLRLIGRSTTVYCTDPIVSDPSVLIDDVGIYPIVPCIGVETEPAKFVSDWPEIKACVTGQDTAKVIFREWEAFDKKGNRATVFDTIVVMRHPQLDRDHLFCQDLDTVYCNDVGNIGPFLIVESTPGSGICDTIYLISAKVQSDGLSFVSNTTGAKCDLQVHVSSNTFGALCDQIYRVEVDIKQTCAGGPNLAPCTVPIGNDIVQIDAAGTYWRCSFWLHNLDTLPPTAVCNYEKYNPDLLLAPGAGFHCFDTPPEPGSSLDAPLVLVSAGTHDCAAYSELPSICASDDWSGVAIVKATILGLGTFQLEKGDTCVTGAHVYDYAKQVVLPFKEEPYQVIYEVFDGCHNIDTLYCYILVKDNVIPVAVADKGVIVDLAAGQADQSANKKVWVDAETFNEGSWDNCGLSITLARRADWYEACMDLCDSTIDLCTHHDLVLKKGLLDQETSVEAHYAKTLEWLKKDGNLCTAQLYNGWMFDLAYYATIDCDTSYPLSREKFYDIVLADSCDLGLNLSMTNPFGCAETEADKESVLIKASQLGGGWSDMVPFDCDDACQNVRVELLVMDYWCNWSKSWSDVWVEDKAPLTIVKDVTDGEISCSSYRRFSQTLPGQVHLTSLEAIVELAQVGDADAIAILDSTFGGYQKAWLGTHGSYVDADGIEIGGYLDYLDNSCVCLSDTVQVRVFDEHLGYLWKDSITSVCVYDTVARSFSQGIIAVNCAQNVYCKQTIWSDFDHCGQGTIYRKFKIWQGCSYASGSQGAPDTITRIQRIYVGNSCLLQKEMFSLPTDAEVFACGIDYELDGSGNVGGAAHPDSVGRPEYLFDDDCRIVGIAHDDKVFRVVGGDQACYKIIRTWYFADWCTNGQAAGTWWKAGDIALDSFVQKIQVRDTLPAICVITGPVEDGGVIEAGGCVYDLEARVDVMDACGVINYYWELNLRNDDGSIAPVASYAGGLNTELIDQFFVSVGDLTDGVYHLKVRITDDCQNESYCTYDFEVAADKKPSPVCITTVTVELTPMDLDRDGELDTAMATVWAEEFNSSSLAPCGQDDDDLRFFLEIVSIDNPTFESLDTLVDADSLVVGCQNVGVNVARLWVLSPTGTVDFCDVYLVVQSNGGGCPEVLSPISMLSGQIVTADTQNVGGVTVMATGSETMARSIDTEDDGQYEFAFNIGEEVMLMPSKNEDAANGVTLLDAVAVFGHVNGGTPFTEPMQRIAADVDASGTIAQADVLIIRSVAILASPQFPIDSWRFVRSEYAFATDTPEQEFLDQGLGKSSLEVNAPMIEQDFYAVKTGDVNNDRITTARSGRTVVFEAADQLMQKGQRIDLQIKTKDLHQLAGFQFTLNFDPSALAFEEIIGGDYLRDDHFGLRFVEDGKVLVGWLNEGWDIKNDAKEVMQVRFTARKEGRLSDAITVNDSKIKSEGYYDVRTVASLALKFNDDPTLFGMRQNYPNPWTHATIIEANFETATAGDLVIYDVMGRLIYTEARTFDRGLNTINIYQKDIGTNGVYYYTLSAQDFTRTRKMILLD